MSLMQKFKAWRRGDKSIKGATRGRMYTKKSGGTKYNPQPEIKLTMEVTRANGDKEVING